MASDKLSTQNTLLSKLSLSSSLSTSLLSTGLTSTQIGDARKRKSEVSSHTEQKRSKDVVQPVSKLSENLSSSLKLSTTTSSLLTKSSLLSSASLKSSLLTSSAFSSYLEPTQKTEESLSKLKLEKERKSKRETDVKVKVRSHGQSLKVTKPKVPVLSKLAPDSRKVVKKKEKKVDKIRSNVCIKYHSIEYPEYDLARDSIATEIYRPKFVPPTKDKKLVCLMRRQVDDVNGIKLGLINAVSASLISQPNFKDSRNQSRVDLTLLTQNVIQYDPEFILKVALYSRKELNIRTTSNFLLALAANVSACRPYLKKYFSASINLPSDWIEVAEIYQAFHDDSINYGSLPSALRRCMIAKFPSFDQYQLAKYNKDSSKNKKKNKKGGDSGRGRGGAVRGRGGRGRGGRGRGARGGFGYSAPGPLCNIPADDDDSDDEGTGLKRMISGVSYDEEMETDKELEQKSFTIKQLIRKLHIVEPVEHVMCLVGKKYPENLEEFYKCRLPGTWNEERAGKRMKLPVPETWETQVSLKGNKASTWEQLLDNKKLPFMAMLRNLRNLIKSGISAKHHASVLKRLTDERQVVNSRQFPFRFFSAYEALTQLAKEYEENQQMLISEAEAKASGAPPTLYIRGRGRGRGGSRGTRGKGKPKGTGTEWWLKKQAKKKQSKEVPYDLNIIARYKKALDTSVVIATKYNVQPIKGRTWIFCNVGHDMDSPCTSAKGLGKPRTKKEVAILMGLMCKYSCEECEMFIYKNDMYSTVSLKKGTILDNMESVLRANTTMSGKLEGMDVDMPVKVLYDALRDRVQIDNIIILTPNEFQLKHYLPVYRRLVNPNLLYASISFGSNRAQFSSIIPEHDNDIYIAGYSDSILRFIAEKGDSGQLLHVENIDTAYTLKPVVPIAMETPPKPVSVDSPERPLAISSNTPKWRTARIFISSTFRDMHGERDLLTRFVFPELRERGRKHFINVYEVDLRWGVTEEETRSQRTLGLCLQEISKCHFFLGILGERYGWQPDTYDVEDTPEFDWLKTCPPGASVTELEMQYGALAHAEKVFDKAFFFLRDNGFEKDIPKEFLTHFVSENEDTLYRMNKLKNRIRQSGLEVFDRYPCKWGGLVNEKAIVAGLEIFGLRVLSNLWTAIHRYYPDEDAMLDEETHISKLHQAYIDDRQTQFIGRKALLKQCISKIITLKHGLLAVVGKSGCGKSSLMSQLVHQYLESKHCYSADTVVVHMVGAAPGSTNIVATIRRISHHLNTQFGLDIIIPEDFRNLVLQFGEILKEASKVCRSKLVLFIDGVDMMEDVHQPYSMEWLPNPLPQNVAIVMSVLEDNRSYKSLKRLLADEVLVTGLDMFDKSEIIRKTLAAHRKSLDETPFNNQLKLLVSKKEAPNPLYLKLACDELRVFGVFEKISQKLKSLPHTVPHLLQEIILRLETDHGKDMVSVALTLLVVVREGLLSEELSDLLALQKILGKTRYQVKDVMNILIPQDQILLPVIFSYLKRSIQNFLNPSGLWDNKLELAHKEIAQAARNRYLRGSAAELEPNLHKLLAGYFYVKADPLRNGSFTGTYTRAFNQLTYHLACSGSFTELKEVICNPCFISQKCNLGLAEQLLEDYTPKGFVNKTLDRDQNKFLNLPIVQEYKSFVSRTIHILTSYPALYWQQALNEPDTSTVYHDAVDKTKSGCTDIMSWINKPQKVNPCYQTISNLKEPVTCVAVSPDNVYFATGSIDCLVRLYDLQTGKEVKMFCGHSDPISDVCFAGKSVLCSASYDNTVSLWHVDNGHRIAVLKNHKRRVNSCASDLAGKLVASASWDCTVKVWNANNGEQSCYLNVGSPVNCVDFHPEGQLIVTGSWDTLIKVWDVFHKTRKAILRGHVTSVRDVAYSPSGRHIASASLDGEVKLWSAFNGSQVGNIQGHSLPINKLTFTATGQELVTVSDDQKVKVWSGHLGIPVHCLGSDKHGPVTSIVISNDGELVVTGYHQGHIRGFNTNTGSNLYTVKNTSKPVLAVKFTSDDQNILIGVDDGDVMVCIRATGQKVSILQGHEKPVLTIDTTKHYIATGGEDFAVCLHTDLKKIKTSRFVKPSVIIRRHTAPVTSCTLSGNYLATASRDCSIIIWDLKSILIDSDALPLQHIVGCHSDWINGCVWSNTGDYLVTASNDFNLKLWHVNLETTESTTEKQKLTGHMSAVNSIDYKYGCIVSGSSDGTVKVWSHKGTEITTLYGHTQRVNGCSMHVTFKDTDTVVDDKEDEMDWAAAVDNDETEDKKKKPKYSKPDRNLSNVIVATCSDDGTVRIWKPLQANELASLTGHSDRVVSVATDKSGNVCTSSLDKSVKLWTPELSDVKAIGRHDSDITFIIVSKSSDLVITGSRDGVVKLWKDSKDSKVGMICVYSFQADEKTITDACFLNNAGSKFVTGSSSGQLKVWDVSTKTGELTVICHDVFNVESPILSVTWNDKQTNNQYFLVLEWNGRITSWNLSTKKSVLYQQGLSEAPLINHLKLKFAVSSPKLIITTTESTVAFPTIDKLQDTSTALDYKVIPVVTDESHIAEQKRVKNWILAAEMDGNYCYCGDSKGQLTLLNETRSETHTIKIHNSAINSIVKSGQHLFTASSDSTIKVWNIEAIRKWNHEEAQVGLFMNQAPVLTLCSLSSSSYHTDLMCGDLLGNINVLKWYHN